MVAPLPTTRVSRLAQGAKAASCVGAAAVGIGGSKRLEDAARALSALRGPAAKAGQWLGYVEGFAPGGQATGFENAFWRLQDEAMASPVEPIAQIIREELGALPEALFERWNSVPVKSGSVGQVHRARLRDGRSVAVKVQHPGIEAAMRADLANARWLEFLVARLAPASLNARELSEELARQLLRELDYESEARNLTAFEEAFAEDEFIYVPRLVPELSRRRVLTTHFSSGESFRDALTHSERHRQFYAETLFRFFVTSVLRAGAFNADPHPGNYLFCRDSKVVFLDFGCVQQLAPARAVRLRRLLAAALEANLPAFEAAVRDYFALRGGDYEAGMQRFMRCLFRPMFEERFRFERSFIREATSVMRLLRGALKTRDGSLVPLPREVLLLHRALFGLYAVLARLGAIVPTRAIGRAALA